jgi:hypothetical protein
VRSPAAEWILVVARAADKRRPCTLPDFLATALESRRGACYDSLSVGGGIPVDRRFYWTVHRAVAQQRIGAKVPVAASGTTWKGDFVKVTHGRTTLLIGSEFSAHGLEEALAGGEGELGRRYTLTRVGSSPSSRVFRFSVPIDGANRSV